MLDSIHIEDVLFLDIETVPQQPVFENLDESFQKLWDKKSLHFRKTDETASDVYQRAGIYAEFGKIICISVGYIYHHEGQNFFRAKSFFGENEKDILLAFCDMLKVFASKKNIQLCAHNGKEFDFPYIARRLLIHGLAIPKLLDIAGKKPWETSFIDTLELWKFGDYKNFTSLELLTKIFGIPTPKDDIDGSQVAKVYYEEKNLTRIAVYCEKDVLAIAQLLLRFKGDELIKAQNCQLLTTL